MFNYHNKGREITNTIKSERIKNTRKQEESWKERKKERKKNKQRKKETCTDTATVVYFDQLLGDVCTQNYFFVL